MNLGAIGGIVGGVLNPVSLIANAGLGILGGGLDYWAAEKDRASQEEINKSQTELALKQMELQKEFAQQGIRWRVADAEAAGLHPLAALGASTPGYSPVALSLENPRPGESVRALSRMGQNVGRAMMAGQTALERKYQTAQIENMGLQNELLAVQVANAKVELENRQVGPPMPGFEEGVIPERGLERQTSGTLKIVPSKDWAERSYGQLMGPLGWSIRNKLMPEMMGDIPMELPPDNWAKARGYRGYRWSRFGQMYVPFK